jgi:hypothetical protein
MIWGQRDGSGLRPTVNRRNVDLRAQRPPSKGNAGMHGGPAGDLFLQFGTSARGRARNSCADPNVWGCKPSERINNSSDSRTEMSSSTTNTIGVAVLGDDFDWPGALAALLSSLEARH